MTQSALRVFSKCPKKLQHCWYNILSLVWIEFQCRSLHWNGKGENYKKLGRYAMPGEIGSRTVKNFELWRFSFSNEEDAETATESQLPVSIGQVSGLDIDANAN